MKSVGKSILVVLLAVVLANSGWSAVYEAETCSLYKAVTETKNGGFSGDSYINFDNEKGSYLELRVGMQTSGNQKITVRYANGTPAARPMKIELNDAVVSESLSFAPTGSWTNWDTVSITAEFREGLNLLRCTSMGSEGGPNIDLFEISGEQAQSFSVQVLVDGNGQVLQFPQSDLLFSGEKITLVAKPDFNSKFKNWSGDFNATTDTLEFVLNGNKNIQVHFTEINLEIPEPDFSMIGYATVPGEGNTTTTGGAGGKITVIETLNQLVAWGADRENNYTAETIIIKGKIEASESTVVTIKRGKDISILGASDASGEYGELKNISLNIRDYSNVIVRNLKMHEVFYPNDDLTIDNCHHVWIDHCEFHSKVGNGIGYDTYDGLLDIKKGSRNVTVSWCYFHDHMKTVLIGHSDSNGEQDVNLEITFHHNWFSNTDGRNPSLRFGKLHYFNNYLENISDYGFAVRNGAHAKIENCHFENVKLPIASDKFEGHGFACISGCIYSGTTLETDNEINPPYACEFWETLPYSYALENTNTVNLSVREYAGVGIVNTITSVQAIKNEKGVLLTGFAFNPVSKNISAGVTLKKRQTLILSLYTLEGKKLRQISEELSQGNHNLTVDAATLKSGLYLFSIETENERITKKIVL